MTTNEVDLDAIREQAKRCIDTHLVATDRAGEPTG
ncbi:MAG: hypothetical protein ACI8UR_001848 [Natronomonas sp.]|jgi:hypothetical protein